MFYLSTTGAHTTAKLIFFEENENIMAKFSRHDPQQNLVYEWEFAQVDYIAPKEVLSTSEMEMFVTQVSKDLMIRPVSVISTNSNLPCRAIFREWAIEIAPWGRSQVTVLHEMAHFGTIKQIMKGAEPHGPEFVGVAIGLYVAYLGFDKGYLIKTAENSGIRVGEVPEFKGRKKKDDSKRLFDGIDF